MNIYVLIPVVVAAILLLVVGAVVVSLIWAGG